MNRREFSQSMLMSIIACWALPLGCGDVTVSWEEAIRHAGNLASEQERYQYLLKLAEKGGGSLLQKEQLDLLLEMIHHWAFSKEIFLDLPVEDRPRRYLASFIDRKVKPDTYHFPIKGADPSLLPLMYWYRGRMLLHDMLEHGGIQKIPEIKSAYLKEIQQCLQAAGTAYPDNPIIGMHLGKPIPWQGESEYNGDAPAWANHQRIVLEKLRSILHWWVNERQVEDGQYGGGWGDDVEMWRQWIPILIGMEDPLLLEAQEKLSTGLFATDRMAGGYTNRIYDVEHTAEDSADTITPMMHLKPEDQIWQDRAMRIVELMETIWTGRNDRGFLQFKSTYFSSEEVDPSSERACDTVYHPRVIQPALLLWQRTGNKRIGKLVQEWMDTWVEATAREEKGKPAGIVPSAIHWPDGSIGGTTDDWWRPGNHDNDPLYRWPSAMGMMLNTLLLTYHMTGKKQYLEPIFSMAKIFQEYFFQSYRPASEPGNLQWCAEQMASFLPGILAKYRVLTGDKQFDELILGSGDGYTSFRLKGDRQKLEQEFQEQAGAFAYNFEAFTSEVKWTDRVFRFHPVYLNEIIDKPIPSYNANRVFASLTGNIGDALYFPISAVRWRTSAKDFAALVLEAEPSQFRAELFHFGEQSRTLEAELFLLRPGSYQISLKDPAGMLLKQENINLPSSPFRIQIQLPSKRLCLFEVQ